MNRKILIIEDNLDVLGALKKFLSLHLENIDPVCCKPPIRLPDVRRKCLDAGDDLDCIIYDLMITYEPSTGIEHPGFNLLRNVSSWRPDVPIIVLTKSDDSEQVAQLFRCGATEYVNKRKLNKSNVKYLLDKIENAKRRKKKENTSRKFAVEWVTGIVMYVDLQDSTVLFRKCAEKPDELIYPVITYYKTFTEPLNSTNEWRPELIIPAGDGVIICWKVNKEKISEWVEYFCKALKSISSGLVQVEKMFQHFLFNHNIFVKCRIGLCFGPYCIMKFGNVKTAIGAVINNAYKLQAEAKSLLEFLSYKNVVVAGDDEVAAFLRGTINHSWPELKVKAVQDLMTLFKKIPVFRSVKPNDIKILFYEERR